MKTNPDVYEATFFYSLCNLMADFQYENWRYNKLNVKKVKYLSNQLQAELEKSINVLFDKSIDADFTAIADQFVNATEMMQQFFKLGLKIDELPEDKKNELTEKLNNTIKEYLDYEGL